MPFSTSASITDERALAVLVESAGAGPEDTVLDVACGGGLVVCAFARVVPRAELIEPRGGLARAAPGDLPARGDQDGLLSRSFPKPGDEAKIRALFSAAADDDRLGIPVRREGDRIHLAYPIAVLVVDKRPR